MVACSFWTPFTCQQVAGRGLHGKLALFIRTDIQCNLIRWTNGPNWPAGGEIDIVEGVSNYTNNQATIHTNPGCSLASSDPSILNITGTVVGGTNCAAAESNNEGCGVRSPDTHSFGAAFNSIGGGVCFVLSSRSMIQYKIGVRHELVIRRHCRVFFRAKLNSG